MKTIIGSAVAQDMLEMTVDTGQQGQLLTGREDPVELVHHFPGSLPDTSLALVRILQEPQTLRGWRGECWPGLWWSLVMLGLPLLPPPLLLLLLLPPSLRPTLCSGSQYLAQKCIGVRVRVRARTKHLPANLSGAKSPP